jgi:hypothetical protein
VNNHRGENFTAYNKDSLESPFINISEETTVSIFRAGREKKTICDMEHVEPEL